VPIHKLLHHRGLILILLLFVCLNTLVCVSCFTSDAGNTRSPVIPNDGPSSGSTSRVKVQKRFLLGTPSSRVKSVGLKIAGSHLRRAQQKLQMSLVEKVSGCN